MTADRLTRVLNVVHYPVFGGPHNQALRLADPLRQRGWETVVLLPDEPGNAKERLTESGVPVEAIPLGRVRTLGNVGANLRAATGLGTQVRGIRRVIREGNIGLVQVSGLVNPHAAFAARLERVPIVWQILDTRLPAVATVPSMALVRTLSDAVMCTGRAVAKAHPGALGLRDRLFFYFPPVDVEQFKPRPEERIAVRRAWGVADDVAVIGCVANLNPQKGILELVAAFAAVRSSHPRAALVLVGAGHSTHVAYTSQIHRLIESEGLTLGRDVILTGARSDVHLQLAGMDLFAFSPTARGEGISTVVLEAMAVGLPVVTTSVAGLPEAINQGIDGVLVPSSDTDAFGEAIGALLDRPLDAARLGTRARAKAEAEFSLSSAADVHADAYEFATRHAQGDEVRRLSDPW